MEERSARRANKVREARRFDEMAKRKKRTATVNRKLGISISCRVQKPFLKDLDAYRKPLKLSRPAAFLKLATEHLAGLKEPAEKLWEGATHEAALSHCSLADLKRLAVDLA